MRLILVRHGQSPSNIERLLDTTAPGPPLTELGQEQAAALPQALAHRPLSAIYASTLVRTQLTAAPLAAERGLEVQIRDGIREVKAGDLELASGDLPIAAYHEVVFAWAAGDLARRMPGGDTGAETFARYDAVVAEAAAHDNAVVFSHGAVIRMWVAGRATNLPAGFAEAHPLENTGIVVLDGDPAGGWRVDSWTDRVVGGLVVASP
jgi:broad specificity phosphatase PhoE